MVFSLNPWLRREQPPYSTFPSTFTISFTLPSLPNPTALAVSPSTFWYFPILQFQHEWWITMVTTVQKWTASRSTLLRGTVMSPTMQKWTDQFAERDCYYQHCAKVA